MPILTADSVSKSFGTRTLFEGASFAVEEGEKLGFIGPNGSGKSTLFRIVAGLESPDTGNIAIRRGATVGYLAQEPSFEPGQTIRAAVAAGRPDMEGALRDYADLARRLENGEGDARLLASQQSAMTRIEALGGWGWEHEVETILTRVGLTDWERQVDKLSGGEKKRVALGRALLERPDILLLDEPTNHLDADTTLWLEEHLLEYSGAVLLITHDRYFLDRVVDRMVEVHPTSFTSYVGGYSEYLEAKAERAEREQVESAKRDRLMEQELAWVKRSPAARTGKQKARIKRLEGMQSKASAAPRQDDGLGLRFGPPPRLGRTVLDLDKVGKSFGERTIIRSFSTQLKAGERIGVIGPNGAGKTTLLKMLIGETTPDSGTIKLGHNTQIAYFDQARADLDPDRSVYETVATEEWVTFGGRKVHARSYLESFLFPSRMQDQRVGSLSGGERNRLLLARLLLDEANLLLLDEPTNDLDLDTLRALESALADFAGCVLVVTHDRFFLDKVATGLLVFEGDGSIHRHEGGYDLYRRLREQKAAEPAKVEKKTPPSSRGSSPDRARKLSYNEKRELEGIEGAILAAEARRDDLGLELSDPNLYVETPEKVAPLRERLAEAEAKVAELYRRWEELESLPNSG